MARLSGNPAARMTTSATRTTPPPGPRPRPRSCVEGVQGVKTNNATQEISPTNFPVNDGSTYLVIRRLPCSSKSERFAVPRFFLLEFWLWRFLRFLRIFSIFLAVFSLTPGLSLLGQMTTWPSLAQNSEYGWGPPHPKQDHGRCVPPPRGE